MSNQLRVDLERFRSFVPRFEGLEAQTVSARSTLTQGLDGEGECWGADDVGSAFASNYVTASKDTVDAITGLSQIFDLIGDKIGRTADSFERTDTGFGGTLGSIAPGNGG